METLGRSGMRRFALLLAGALLGGLSSLLYQASAEEGGGAVYVVVSASVVDPEGLGPYAEAAGLVALESGLEILARTESVSEDYVFEGEWPFEGGLTIERFESMEAFKEFWYSDAYQAAIPLREGKVDINFIVAVPSS